MVCETRIVRVSEVLDKLEYLGVPRSKLRQYSVVCLPENFFEGSPGEMLDAEHTLTLAKHLKEIPGIPVAHSFDLGLDIPRLERRSNHKWLGVIWIRDRLAVPFVVGVLSSLLVVSLTSGKHSRKEKPTVHVEILIEEGDQVRAFKYVGEADTLLQLMDQNRDDREPGR